MLRNDAASARLGVRFSGLHGVRSNMRDFMPWPVEEPQPASAQEVLEFLKSKVRKGSKHGIA